MGWLNYVALVARSTFAVANHIEYLAYFGLPRGERDRSLSERNRSDFEQQPVFALEPVVLGVMRSLSDAFTNSWCFGAI